ncbi:MAG: trimeric intracellular cation channel family protein [Pseudomonadota bacterium]
MSPELIPILADRLGVFVFALSGGIVAIRKDMDLFGVIVLAFLPAIGGGTLRDLLLDQPVFWLADTTSLGLAVAGGLTVFVFHRAIDAFKPLRWADAMGMALFAVTGAAKAMALGYGLGIVLIMGALTASAGGLLRDVVANEEPLLLKSDIYATAALLASLAYFTAISAGATEPVAFGIAWASGFALRSLAFLRGWSLPKSPF